MRAPHSIAIWSPELLSHRRRTTSGNTDFRQGVAPGALSLYNRALFECRHYRSVRSGRSERCGGPSGLLAMISCELRQARKGATVAVTSCAGGVLVGLPPIPSLQFITFPPIPWFPEVAVSSASCETFLQEKTDVGNFVPMLGVQGATTARADDSVCYKTTTERAYWGFFCLQIDPSPLGKSK